MADNTTGSSHLDEPQLDEPNASSALRQRLLTVEEVYVYKIPPLKNAGGHRAEDWNLANPLQTCRLIVERRGDVLVLEFTVSGALFCQSVIDLSPSSAAAASASANSSSSTATTLTMDQLVESAVDTSRYFVTRIQGPKKAGGSGTNTQSQQSTALIGFGFRERDTAVDFRESLQFYQRAMQREKEADQSTTRPLAAYSIPKLGNDEKIHVNLGGSGGGKKKVSTTITKSSTGACPTSPGAATGAVPLLLKKPPPPSASGPATGESPSALPTASQQENEQLATSLGHTTLDGPDEPNTAPDADAGDGEYDENDWAEFQSAG